MRFGKRLVEWTLNGRANAPYISYKELKHTVGVLSRLIGSGGGADDDDDGGSSDDAAVPRLIAATLSRASDTGSIGLQGPELLASSAAAPAAAPISAAPSSADCVAGSALRRRAGTGRLDAHQREFFGRINSDVTQAVGHVQGGVVALEAAVGEWQMCAMDAGLLFTPEKLEQVSEELDFRIEDKSMLVDWLAGLRPDPQADRRELIEKFASISSQVNSLLQYIELNLMAVRKILKKFEKKVPAELRMRSASDYRAHYGIFTKSMQNVLETTAYMQRVVIEMAQELGPEAAAKIPSISQLGPECATALSSVVRTGGSSALEDLLGMSQPAALIDVYAKPMTDGGCPNTNVSLGLSLRKPANQPVTTGVQHTPTAIAGGAYPSSAKSTPQRPAEQWTANPAPQPAPAVGSQATAQTNAAASGNAGSSNAPRSEQRTGQGRRRGGQRGGGRGRRSAAASDSTGLIGAGNSHGAAGGSTTATAAASAGAPAGGAWAPSAGSPSPGTATAGTVVANSGEAGTVVGVGLPGAGQMGLAFGGTMIPQPCFTQVPAYVGQTGSFRGWPAVMAGRGDGCKATGGKGAAGRGGVPASQAQEGTASSKDRSGNVGGAFAVGGLMGVGVGGVPNQSASLDPTWLAAMMPMIWSGQGGVHVPIDMGG